MQVDIYSSPGTKLKSKWIRDVNIKLDMLILIEEEVGNNFELVGTGKDFLNGTLLARR